MNPITWKSIENSQRYDLSNFLLRSDLLKESANDFRMMLWGSFDSPLYNNTHVSNVKLTGKILKSYLFWSCFEVLSEFLFASECFFKKSIVLSKTVVLSIFRAAFWPSCPELELIMEDNSETKTLNWSRRFFSLWLRDLRLVSSRSSPKSSMVVSIFKSSFQCCQKCWITFLLYLQQQHWTTLLLNPGAQDRTPGTSCSSSSLSLLACAAVRSLSCNTALCNQGLSYASHFQIIYFRVRTALASRGSST